MNNLRTAAQQALEALEYAQQNRECPSTTRQAISALRAALAQEPQDVELSAALGWPGGISTPILDRAELLRMVAKLAQEQAEPKGGGNLPPPLQEPTVAENATSQQQLEDTPPSDYRRGYWDGFNIGKREGRIEAEDAAQQAEPVQEPVAMDWLHKWANQDDGEPETQWHEGYEAARRVVQIHLTAPPQRRPLTDEEIRTLALATDDAGGSVIEFARAVERAHGIGEEK